MTYQIFMILEHFVYTKIFKNSKIGLGKGGSLENAIVIKDASVLNKEGFKKQFRIC